MDEIQEGKGKWNERFRFVWKFITLLTLGIVQFGGLWIGASVGSVTGAGVGGIRGARVGGFTGTGTGAGCD